jgi:multidrug resistance efflux pump
MKRNQIENQGLPADWPHVIDQVQDVLAQTEKTAGERERTLTREEPNPLREKNTVWQPTLEHFEERLRRFHASLQKAEDHAEEADLALADGERALQNWLDRASRSAPRKEHLT